MKSLRSDNQPITTTVNSLTPKFGIALFVVTGLGAAFWLWTAILASI